MHPKSTNRIRSCISNFSSLFGPSSTLINIERCNISKLLSLLDVSTERYIIVRARGYFCRVVMTDSQVHFN